MTRRSIHPDVLRKTYLINKWREVGNMGRLFWRNSRHYRTQTWQPNVIARVMVDGVIVQRFYSLDELADYLNEATPAPVGQGKRRNR